MHLASFVTVLACLATFAHAYYPCSSTDWTISTTDCDAGDRKTYYEWITPKVCRDGDSLPADAMTGNCECTLNDFTKSIGICNTATGTATLSYSVNAGKCTGGVALPADSTVPCACKNTDVETSFSECDSNGNRFSFSYYKNSCTQHADVTLPAVTESSCSIVCGPGKWLDTSCHTCKAGTYSVGGGLYFAQGTTWSTNNSLTNTLPTQLSTNCVSTNGGDVSSSCPSGGWEVRT